MRPWTSSAATSSSGMSSGRSSSLNEAIAHDYIGAMEAVVIVDVQNDFCPGGALAVEEGDQVIPVINRMAGAADVVVATRDWHPENHHSFEREGGPWPEHCVQGSPGAELRSDLDHDRIAAV